MFQKEYLNNNIPLVMERITGVRSITLGIWVKVGSRFENAPESGLSHFLEHMFFKGTEKRSQKEIAFEIDSLGGDLNAFTSKETTTFYIKVLDEYLDRGMELLSDIFLNSVFPEEEIEKEKGVILEEIRMSEDTPDDYVHDLFSEYIWGGRGLGQRILGSYETVRSFKRENLIEYIHKHYRTDNIVVSCAGNIDYKAVQDGLNETIGRLNRDSTALSFEKPTFHSGVRVVQRDHAEVHICMGVEGVPQNSPDRYAMLLLNTIMGMGVSSRLFQEIREERGLAYSVYSFASSYIDTGVFGVYVGTSPEKYREVIELVKKQFDTFRDTVTEEELTRAKRQLRGNIILALESTSGRMSNIARQEIYYGRYYSPSEIIKTIDSVSLSDIKALSERLFTDRPTALTMLGPVKED